MSDTPTIPVESSYGTMSEEEQQAWGQIVDVRMDRLRQRLTDLERPTRVTFQVELTRPPEDVLIALQAMVGEIIQDSTIPARREAQITKLEARMRILKEILESDRADRAGMALREMRSWET